MSFVNIIVNYFKGAYRELGKVSWPTRQEIIYLTLIVITVIVAAVLILGSIDFGLTELINLIINK